MAEATAIREQGRPPGALKPVMLPGDTVSAPTRTPGAYPGVYRERQRQNGRQYYGSIGILGDRKASEKQQVKNYSFFGAPVGIFFFTELNYLNAWRDCGMFIQSVMLAARAEGLHTISQGAWTNFEGLVRKHTGADSQLTLLCGMGLGYDVADDPVNQFRTPRPPLAECATFKW